MAKRKDNIRNCLTFHDFYSRLKLIALSMFEWDGLPVTCNARFLENCLYHYGRAIFVDDPTMGVLNLKTVPASTLNVYQEPTAYQAFSINYSQIYDADDCVLVRNNLLEKSTDSTILLFAERLTKIQLALEVNIMAQRTPVLIRCDERTRTSLEAVYDQYAGDRPVIFGSKSLQEKPLEAINTGAPYVADKLREEKREVWNEAFEFLGFNTNPNDHKKERQIVSEVDANNEQIKIQSESMLLCRKLACERLNEKYKCNASVKMRVQDDREMLALLQGVVNNG